MFRAAHGLLPLIEDEGNSAEPASSRKRKLDGVEVGFLRLNNGFKPDCVCRPSNLASLLRLRLVCILICRTFAVLNAIFQLPIILLETRRS